LTAAAASLGAPMSMLFGGTTAENETARGFVSGSILDMPATEAPIDHVVVLMMENRSFDHYLGWLASDGAFLDNGRRVHSRHFYVEGEQSQVFRDPELRLRHTYYLPSVPNENPYRGCGHETDLGHSWKEGRAQRDHGFLARMAGNDDFALGYYAASDLPLFAYLARRFTSFDRFHCSLLAPTFPNRQYLHAAQSGGSKINDWPASQGFTWATIWDRLREAGVPAAYYYVDLPTIAFWGRRLVPFARGLDAYFSDCADGTLPNVVFLDPGFTSELRTDDHPFADIRQGQRFMHNLVKAFGTSPHWDRGVFIITYDEWGGFFDHVRPPVLPDDRASAVDADNFGQAGFRVPTLMASPYARRGFVDHRLYDHTSILRFIEWRFLGAPAEGGAGSSSWYLTSRDRYAQNLGRSLLPEYPDRYIELEGMPESAVSEPCRTPPSESFASAPVLPRGAFDEALDSGFFDSMGYDIQLRPLPY
jgi:phospholipase C